MNEKAFVWVQKFIIMENCILWSLNFEEKNDKKKQEIRLPAVAAAFFRRFFGCGPAFGSICGLKSFIPTRPRCAISYFVLFAY